MSNIKRFVKLYLHYISVNVRSMMQYKTSFFFTTLGQFLVSFSTILGLYFLFQRFQKIEEYSYTQVLLCYALVSLEFSIAEMFGRGFDGFNNLVKQGTFDRILIRPQNEILQVLGSRFELTRLGRTFQAIIVLIYSLIKIDVSWTLYKGITIFFMILGGITVFFCLHLIYASLCFFTLEGLEIVNIFTHGAMEHGKYPLGIYGKKILIFSTFVIPYALFQYYPLLYIYDKSSDPLYGILPLFAILFLIPCYCFWRFGVRHYKSSGS